MGKSNCVLYQKKLGFAFYSHVENTCMTVLLVAETEAPGENHRPVASY
jgi:hypothetical protein